MPRFRMVLHVYLNALIINSVLSEPMHTPASARFLSVISTPGWEYVEPWKYWSNESAMFGARQILTPVGPFHVDVFSSAGKNWNAFVGRYEKYYAQFYVSFLSGDEYKCTTMVRWTFSGPEITTDGVASIDFFNKCDLINF